MKLNLAEQELLAILKGEAEDHEIVKDELRELRTDGNFMFVIFSREPPDDGDDFLEYWAGFYVRLTGPEHHKELHIRPDWPDEGKERPYQFTDVCREEGPGKEVHCEW